MVGLLGEKRKIVFEKGGQEGGRKEGKEGKEGKKERKERKESFDPTSHKLALHEHLPFSHGLIYQLTQPPLVQIAWQR